MSNNGSSWRGEGGAIARFVIAKSLGRDAKGAAILLQAAQNTPGVAKVMFLVAL
jgi:hypothetical protein